MVGALFLSGCRFLETSLGVELVFFEVVCVRYGCQVSSVGLYMSLMSFSRLLYLISFLKGVSGIRVGWNGVFAV